jgi:hypothetical protein
MLPARAGVPRSCDRLGCQLGPEKPTVGPAECRFHATATTTVDDFGLEAAAFGLDAADIVTEIVELLLHCICSGKGDWRKGGRRHDRSRGSRTGKGSPAWRCSPWIIHGGDGTRAVQRRSRHARKGHNHNIAPIVKATGEAEPRATTWLILSAAALEAEDFWLTYRDARRSVGADACHLGT